MKIYEIFPNIIHVSFATQHLMTSTLLRFQEYYESPKFRGKSFSIKDVTESYVQEEKPSNYFLDFTGFNFPSNVITPFREGMFDPLTTKERAFLRLFQNNNGSFYIIGTSRQDPSQENTLRHELAHGFFSTDAEYRAQVLEVVESIDTRAIEAFLRCRPYHRSVWADEKHAFILCGLEQLREEGIETAPFMDAQNRLDQIFNKRLAGD